MSRSLIGPVDSERRPVRPHVRFMRSSDQSHRALDVEALRKFDCRRSLFPVSHQNIHVRIRAPGRKPFKIHFIRIDLTILLSKIKKGLNQELLVCVWSCPVVVQGADKGGRPQIVRI